MYFNGLNRKARAYLHEGGVLGSNGVILKIATYW